MSDLADAAARWGSASLRVPLRRSWHVVVMGHDGATALVSDTGHSATLQLRRNGGSGSGYGYGGEGGGGSGGSEGGGEALQSAGGGTGAGDGVHTELAREDGGRAQPTAEGSGQTQPLQPDEGSGDYPGDVNDVNFPKYDKSITQMVDQCKKPKEIKDKAMSGEDDRKAIKVNSDILKEYKACIQKIHHLAKTIMEARQFSSDKNVEYTGEAVKFLKELSFMENYTAHFNAINDDFMTASNYLLGESRKVIKYLDDLVSRRDPIPLEKDDDTGSDTDCEDSK